MLSVNFVLPVYFCFSSLFFPRFSLPCLYLNQLVPLFNLFVCTYLQGNAKDFTSSCLIYLYVRCQMSCLVLLLAAAFSHLDCKGSFLFHLRFLSFHRLFFFFLARFHRLAIRMEIQLVPKSTGQLAGRSSLR